MRLIETTKPGALNLVEPNAPMPVGLIQEGARTEVGEVDIATRFELISEAENLLTRRATMFAARFASSYNQSFPNNDGKSATINREIEL